MVTNQGPLLAGFQPSDALTPQQGEQLLAYRLGRVQEQLRKRDCAGAVLFDSINMRYATGSRNYQLFQLHTPTRYAFVPAEGKVTLFDLTGWSDAAKQLTSVGDVRPGTLFCYFFAGPRVEARANSWANEINQLVRSVAGTNRRIALDKAEPIAVQALRDQGLTIINGQEVLEEARVIKSPEEILCMREAIRVCERGMMRMREALKPGLSENELWSILHQTNIAMDGEWIDCRLLASGPRTNPWNAECSNRKIEEGDLVAFDTDLIGPYGYCADISRTFHCGPVKPTSEQKRLYQIALHQIQHNLSILRPGISYQELAEKSWPIPGEFIANRYPEIFHGIGMCDEFPLIPPHMDWNSAGYEGILLEGMTLCVESYIGSAGGKEGVKLEEQVYITSSGYEQLSSFPLEYALLD
jgi:Xaa-Pro dipeptidase